MVHNRRLAFSGVAMTNARLRGNRTFVAAEIVREELEGELIVSNYFNDNIFKNISISIRYGLKYDNEPVFWKINKKNQELPMAIEIDVNDLLEADQQHTNAIFRKAALIALVNAGEKYGLKVDRMKELLAAA